MFKITKGIGTSLSRYLNRNNDELNWVATNLKLVQKAPSLVRER